MSIRHIPIAIRAHTVRKDQKDRPERKQREDLRKPYGQRILVFDTETRTDIYMNLMFGQAMIVEGSSQAHIDGLVKEHYLFYGDNLSSEEITILRQYAKDKRVIFLSEQEFIDDIFLPEIWELGSACVGFNLPFDLSRLASSTRTFHKGKHRDEVEFKLSNSNYKPTILVHPIDSKKAFISLRFPTRPKTSSKRIPFREGRFIDLRTLVFALTNESHSLDSACKLYQVKHGKGVAEKHGVITPEYVEYNRQDVEATLELYCKVKAEFDRHPLTLEAGKAYSPATIGKAYYKAMNIEPFDKKQPDFPKEILGYAMAAYYGGRSECHYRNTPVKTFHTDITSMYPSVFTLQNLWLWVIAEQLDVQEATEEIKELLDGINIEDLFNKEAWLKVPGLVEVMPEDDLLPVRAEYGRANGYQIGLNRLTSDKPMWYTLADIIACKILTGKIPKIIRAIRIIPGESQEGLSPVDIRGQISIDPSTDNFFKKVIELRKEVKKKIKQKGDENDAMQLFLKILANSTSYGVYIEMNREEFEQEQEIEIFGLDKFSFFNKQFDKNGTYYNPLIAVMITGAARLILAMMEKSILDLDGNYAFCDTDSMAIIDLKNGRPELIGKQVVDKFKSLYPYDDNSKEKGASLLEAEDYNWERLDWNKDTDKQNLKKSEYYPLYCYMVSAKRYVLYNLIPDGNGNFKIIIRKKSDHGLGHLTSPIKGKDRNDWVNGVWKWIISQEHNLPYQEPNWFYEAAFAQLSVSKPSIYNILNRDKGKDYSEQVKPFNFMLVAYPVDDKLFGNHLIRNYYCRLHKSIGLGICQNKSKCKHTLKCFANLHMIPIAPYDKPENWREFMWLEKNTKEPLEVKLSPSRSQAAREIELKQQLEPLLNSATESEKQALIKQMMKSNHEPESAHQNDYKLMVKNYYDFIKEYAFHPELKYNDSHGRPCSRNTKGLLQITHIIATKVKHIGKETNTLQDKEEEAALPDEMNWDDTILSYTNDAKQTSTKIDLEQWEDLRVNLQAEAKPRKSWAEGFNISLDYFKQLLSGRRSPSPQLYEDILSKCKKQQIPIPAGKKPIPRAFGEGKGRIHPLKEVAFTNSISSGTIKAALGDSIFTLHGNEYICFESESARTFFTKWRRQARRERKEVEAKALENIQVKGICLNGNNRELQAFDIDSITHYQVSREIGRSYKTLNVRGKDGSIYKVLQKHNPLVFKYGLLPKASKIPFDQDRKAIEKRNGYKKEYGQWQLFRK